MPNSTAVHSVREPSEEVARVPVERRGDPLPRLHHAEQLLERPGDGSLASYGAADVGALLHVALWAREFLTQPHPDLGRSGHVCPYVSASMREQRFLLTVLHDAATQRRRAERMILRLARYFTTLPPTAGRGAHHKTIVILFPDLPEEQAGALIDGMHQRLKPYFLRSGLMLGEFHRDSVKPGLHNPEFRPLRSDVPLLVIRAMLPGDIVFLLDRARFVRAYIRSFEARGCAEIRSYLQRQGAALADAQRTMLLEQVARYEAHVRGGGISGVRAALRLGPPRPRS